MRCRATTSIDDLAVVGAGRVDLTLVSELLQMAVDSRQTDAMALPAQHGVQILGTAKGIVRRERRQHRAALAGDALARS